MLNIYNWKFISILKLFSIRYILINHTPCINVRGTMSEYYSEVNQWHVQRIMNNY